MRGGAQCAPTHLFKAKMDAIVFLALTAAFLVLGLTPARIEAQAEPPTPSESVLTAAERLQTRYEETVSEGLCRAEDLEDVCSSRGLENTVFQRRSILGASNPVSVLA